MAKKTIKERINSLFDKYVDTEKQNKDYFVTDVFELIERASQPNNFCEKCDERKVYPNECINCGYKKEELVLEKKKIGTISMEGQVKKPIPKKANIAEKMQKLKKKLEGGEGEDEDNKLIKAQDPSLSNKEINWVS